MKWQNQWLEILCQQARDEARRIAAELTSQGA